MSINIFGSGISNIHLSDIGQDLNMNNFIIRNVRSPENEFDAANKTYVDSKIVTDKGWTLEGNTLLTEGRMGTSNDYSFTLVRNNTRQMKFLSNGIVIYNNFYMEKDGGYMGMQALNANREFGVFFGNDRNMITWKNASTQPLRFAASYGFLFTLGRTVLMTMGANIIQAYKNIDMLSSNKIINLPVPVNASDCATKAYSDLKVLKNGDTMTGNLYFDGSTRDIHIGCNNMGAEQIFRLYLGSESNKINASNNDVDIFVGRAITVSIGSNLNIITINSGGITFNKPLSMANCKIFNLDHPIHSTDAVNKQYVDSRYDELNARLQQLESRMQTNN